MHATALLLDSVVQNPPTNCFLTPKQNRIARGRPAGLGLHREPASHDEPVPTEDSNLAERLIDAEEDKYVRAVLVGMLGETDR